jgi:hypothetical protein
MTIVPDPVQICFKMLVYRNDTERVDAVTDDSCHQVNRNGGNPNAVMKYERAWKTL